MRQIQLSTWFGVDMVMCYWSYSTCLTPGSVEPRKAAAGVGPQTVQAAGPIHTGVGITLIHIYLTQPASVALYTLTPKTGTTQLHNATNINIYSMYNTNIDKD